MTPRKLRKEVEMLLAEERELKKTIVRLEEEISLKCENSRFSRQCNSNTGVNITSTTAKISHFRRWLKLSQKTNKVEFVNEEITLLDDGFSECAAEGRVRSKVFHIKLKVKDDQEMDIHSLKVKFEDPFQEAELKYWTNQRVRENDFQTLIEGIVSYVEWDKIRENILNWMISDFSPHFTINKSQEDACVKIIAKTEPDSCFLFSCKWSVLWSKSSSSMIPSFAFRLNKRTQFTAENEYLVQKLASLKITPDEVNDCWRRISVAVVTARESQSVSPESE